MNADWTDLSFSPLGDRALLLKLGGQADSSTVRQVRALGQYLGEQRLPGVLDIVPAVCTLGVHYEPATWRDDAGKLSPYENLVQRIQILLPGLASLTITDGHLYEIPVCYDGEYGEDLPAFARAHDLASEQVVQIHSDPVYAVYMLGFAPGFVYLGQLDERLVSPRRDTPRASVPAGSVAVANEYTGIYPASLPGGWHIIGRTPLQMFDLSRKQPSLLAAGDRVRFVPISAARFRELESAQS
jgi:inhibitor of KinA